MDALLKNKNWLIACSGGPDSMALLAMAKESNLNIQVAHVNYLKRASAWRDEKIVKKYCEDNGIKCHVLDKEYEYKGNFQAFARDYRYAFFKEVCDNEHLDGVLIAHQQDDLIETYLMQKEKGMDVEYYGLKKEINLKGVLVYRPLLDYTKKELEDYCISHNIPYGIDESNLSDDYTRNKIRHQVIDNLDDVKRSLILQEIVDINRRKQSLIDKLKQYLHNKQIYVKEYVCLEENSRYILLKLLFKSVGISDVSLSQIIELDRQIRTAKNFCVDIKGKLFKKSYEICTIQEKFTQGYEFVLQSYCDFETAYFKVMKSGEKINGVWVNDDDYPLTIRTMLPGDFIEMRFGKKKLSRFFIDRKISIEDRKVWPVLVNCRNEIILVPGLGCNVSHYATQYNFFMVKL